MYYLRVLTNYSALPIPHWCTNNQKNKKKQKQKNGVVLDDGAWLVVRALRPNVEKVCKGVCVRARERTRARACAWVMIISGL